MKFSLLSDMSLSLYRRSRVLRICVSLALLLHISGIVAVFPGLFAQATMPTRQPFPLDYVGMVASPSLIDLSYLLDAPAGRQGFLRVANGHIATADGRRMRLWGVNITDWSPGSRQIPDKADAAFWAQVLARFGVNCVRLQFLDLPTPRGLVAAGRTDTRVLDAVQLDREDYFIAQLEKRGIYIDLNLLVGRPFLPGDGVTDADKLREGAKGTSLFDRRLIELQQEYARQLLTHHNPYTSRSYANDPGVAIIEVNNENAINVGYRAPSQFYSNELKNLYNHWLLQHRTSAEIALLRTDASVTDAAVPVPLMAWRAQAATAQPLRFHAEAEFFNDLQHDYFDTMRGFLQQSLHVHSLILATADHSHANSGYPILMATQDNDIIDGHTYWQHPEMYVHKSPMVDDPQNSTVVELSRSALEGKPYTVSEVNEPFPNDYDAEAIPVLAAYGAFQDWDAILWYTFEPKQLRRAAAYVGDPFDISQHPVKMAELAAGALLFLRGDLQSALKVDSRTYTREQVFDSMLLPTTDRPYFTPGFSLTLPLQHEVRIGSFDGPPTQKTPPASNASPIRSDTHQLAWYSGQPHTGLVTVDSPRTQSLIGFLNAHPQVSDTNLSVTIQNAFAAIQVTALDADSIANAHRLLAVVGSQVTNSGATWNTADTALTNWGKAPVTLQPVRGNLILHGLNRAHTLTMTVLNGAAQPVGNPITVKRSGDRWILPLQGVTDWYLITVGR